MEKQKEIAELEKTNPERGAEGPELFILFRTVARKQETINGILKTNSCWIRSAVLYLCLTFCVCLQSGLSDRSFDKILLGCKGDLKMSHSGSDEGVCAGG